MGFFDWVFRKRRKVDLTPPVISQYYVTMDGPQIDLEVWPEVILSKDGGTVSSADVANLVMKEVEGLPIGSVRGHAVAHLKVDYFRGGYFLNGKRASLEKLRREFARLAQIGGLVFYYKQNPTAQIPAEAKAAIDAIIEARLPVTFAARDYDPSIRVSEYVFPKGSWRCVECGNSVKHFLGICWKCGAVRAGGEVVRQAALKREREILSEPWQDVLRNSPKDVLQRIKRDTERGLRRIDLARSIVLSTADHVEGARVVRRLEILNASREEISDSLATYLSDYYGEGYHGELHHTDYSELVVFMLMYKAHQLGANAVINVTLMLGFPPEASGEAVVIEPI